MRQVTQARSRKSQRASTIGDSLYLPFAAPPLDTCRRCRHPINEVTGTAVPDAEPDDSNPLSTAPQPTIAHMGYLSALSVLRRRDRNHDFRPSSSVSVCHHPRLPRTRISASHPVVPERRAGSDVPIDRICSGQWHGRRRRQQHREVSPWHRLRPEGHPVSNSEI